MRCRYKSFTLSVLACFCNIMLRERSSGCKYRPTNILTLVQRQKKGLEPAGQSHHVLLAALLIQSLAASRSSSKVPRSWALIFYCRCPPLTQDHLLDSEFRSLEDLQITSTPIIFDEVIFSTPICFSFSLSYFPKLRIKIFFHLTRRNFS